MDLEHEHFMRLALEEAAKGGAEGNVAVGSIIVEGEQPSPRHSLHQLGLKLTGFSG